MQCACPLEDPLCLCHIQLVAVKVLPILSGFPPFNCSSSMSRWRLWHHAVIHRKIPPAVAKIDECHKAPSPHIHPHIRSRTSTVTMLLPRTTCRPPYINVSDVIRGLSGILQSLCMNVQKAAPTGLMTCFSLFALLSKSSSAFRLLFQAGK